MYGEQRFSKQYKTIKRLGCGAFGKVTLVSNNKNQQYALKSMSKAGHTQEIQYLYQEVKIMKELRSQYIVKFYDWEENQEAIYILMEYCAGGDLRKDMALQKQKVYGFDRAVEIVSDVIRGLEIVHSSGFIHRDIKIENILVHTETNGQKKYKIADFGLSSLESTGTIVLGTGQYMSPQLFDEQIEYGFEVDMWAFGVLLYFLLNREFPFKFNPYSDDLKDKGQFLVNQAKNFSYINSVKKSKLKRIQNCNKYLQDLFKRIFEIDINKRITFAQIRHHPVFKNSFPESIKQSSFIMYKNNNKSLIKSHIVVGKKNKKQLSELQMNVGLKKSMIRPPCCTYPKQQKIIEHKNEEINFLYENFKQFKSVKGILTLIQKIPLCYNLVKYYLILKNRFIKSLKSGTFFKQHPRYKFKQFIKTQTYKKLLIELQDQYESAKYQFQIIHNQCIDCLDEIKKINSKFQQAFNQTLESAEFEDEAFKHSYRKSTSYIFKKLKNLLKKKASGNKYNYFYALVVITHVFNRLFLEKDNCKQVFKRYLRQTQNQNYEQINFTLLREWMTTATVQQLNQITKKVIVLYLHQ